MTSSQYRNFVKGMKTMRTTWFLIAVFGGILAAATAQAQQRCGPTLAVYDTLEETYGEGRIISLQRNSTEIIEVWIAADGPQTWSVLRTSVNGTTCMLDSGTGYILLDFESLVVPSGMPV